MSDVFTTPKPDDRPIGEFFEKTLGIDFNAAQDATRAAHERIGEQMHRREQAFIKEQERRLDIIEADKLDRAKTPPR
ncbi:MAG TPA: hypothetical protein VFC78_02760 [Tepidisphaeraceae bacterium]|nr:hypothetical protein [Tepidisphaeraceae bacterium]